MTAFLDVRELATVFHAASGDVRAVDGLSFSLESGESLALVGESGSGKSVSALSLMGLVPAPGEVDHGQVLFGGRDLLALSSREWQRVRGREIAMIFQDPMTSLNPVLTIGYQLGELLRWHLEVDKAEAEQRVVETLSQVGIPNAGDRVGDYPHEFSGGQRQRIMIAMAVLCRPSLLIADEPTTALDVTIQAQIVALIKELQAELGMAIIWITHDLALIAGLVDTVAVMYAGSIVEYGPVAAVFDDAKHPYTQGLIRSMPRFDRQQTRLQSIDGTPPDLSQSIAGCPFAPRCERVVDQCRAFRPGLLPHAGARRVACWRAVER